MTPTSAWFRLGMRLSALAVCVGCSSAHEVTGLGVYDGESPDGSSARGAGSNASPQPGPAAPSRPDPNDQASEPRGLRPDEPPGGGPDEPRESPVSTPGPRCAAPSCVADAPVDPAEDVNCFDVTARGQGDWTKPYEVGGGVEEYVAFTFTNLTSGARYVRSVASRVGNGVAALRGMRLYQHAAVVPPGLQHGPMPLGGMHQVYAWTQGVPDLYLERGLGIPLERNASLTLEIHYVRLHSSTPRYLADASGMRVCTTSAEVAYPVSISLLGQQEFAGNSAEGVCTPGAAGGIQLLAVQPQLNVSGAHVTLRLQRKSGEQLVVADQAFGFGERSFLRLPFTELTPGDQLLSTCVYGQQVYSGSGSRDELCELHVLHWPAGTLVSQGDGGSCWK